MTVSVATRKTAPKLSQITNWFKQHIELTDQADALSERADVLKTRILDAIAAKGEVDEKGNQFLELGEPVEFKNHEGAISIYTQLKRERYVTPANPTPDIGKSEKFLKLKKLWLKPTDEKAIKDIAVRNQFVKITVSVDVDAIAKALFNGLITDEEYEELLVEQREGFRFKKLTS